ISRAMAGSHRERCGAPGEERAGSCTIPDLPLGKYHSPPFFYHFSERIQAALPGTANERGRLGDGRDTVIGANEGIDCQHHCLVRERREYSPLEPSLSVQHVRSDCHGDNRLALPRMLHFYPHQTEEWVCLASHLPD